MVCPRTFLDMQNRIILFSYRLSLKKSCERYLTREMTKLVDPHVNLIECHFISERYYAITPSKCRFMT